MNYFPIFATQMVLNFISYGLIAACFVYPALKKLPLNRVLFILAFCQMFRQLGLVFLHHGLSGADPSSNFAIITAYGDLISSILGTMTVLSIYYKKSWTMALAWIFNIIGMADFITGYTLGILVHSWNFLTGAGWYVPLFIVPALIICHIMSFIFLIKSNTQENNILVQA